MSMVVKNNIDALRTVNLLDQNNNMLQKHLSRVATGMKINSAQDDAAPWSISERMRMRIRALEQANQNVQNDSALMKTAEGAVSSTIEILKALKEKAINSANDSNTDEDRRTIQKEVDQFIDQIDDNALVQFNGKYLIDGSKNNAVADTCTVFLNRNISTAADQNQGTQLVNLTNSFGVNLGIQSTDTWSISYVMNGTTTTTSGTVGNQTLQNIMNVSSKINVSQGNGNEKNQSPRKDKFDQDLYSPNKEKALFLYGGPTTGTAGQIAGYTISISDAQGNIKKDVNAVLNDFKLLQRAENKTGDKSLTFHTGPEANVAIKVGLTDMRTHALGLKGSDGSKVSVTTKEKANAAINVFDNALKMTLDQQVTIGSVLSRLDYTSSNIITARDNDQESESVIRDADMAKEMTNYTKANVLTQTAQAMLAQANQNSNAVLSLLQ